MNSVMNVIKMDMAICRKSMVIMTISMLVVGIACLFFFTPLLLGFFVIGSTAVVSAIFAVEGKSNMEFFYGCFPVRKWEYIVGRGLTCLLVMAIPAIISIVFIQIGMHFSLYQSEDVRIIMEMIEPYQMLIICALIMLGFVSGANLLLAAFVGKVESREIFEVILLLLEALFVSIIMFFIQKVFYHDDRQAFLNAFTQLLSDHELVSCILFILIGLIGLMAGTIISLKIIQSRRR